MTDEVHRMPTSLDPSLEGSRPSNPDAVKLADLAQPLSQPVPARIWLHDLGCGDITWCDDPAPDGEQIDAVEYIRVDALHQPYPAPDVERLEAAKWLNMMPRAVVASYAYADGCRDETARALNTGHYGGVKLKAEMVVEMIGDLQSDTRACLTALTGDTE